MSARHDFQFLDDALDEIDRLRAQVERDRPVIEAAEAVEKWGLARHHSALYTAVRERRAACVPDEVNEAQ